MHESRVRLAPRALTLPVLGTLGFLARISRHLDYLVQLALDLGPTFRVSTPAFTFICTVDPACVRWMLRDNFANYVKGSAFHERLHDLLGDGIFNVDGDQRRVQRKTASRLFSREALRDRIFPVIAAHYERLRGVIESRGSVDAQDLFMRTTLDVICEVGFGVRIHALTQRSRLPFAAAFDDAQEMANFRFFSPHWRCKRAARIGRERVLADSVRVINEFASGVIAARRSEMSASALDRPDFLTHFMRLQAPDGGAMLNDRQLRDVVLNFMIAGRDTTAEALTWALYELVRNPRCAERVRREVEHLSRGGAAISFENVEQMRYTRAVIAETLRLHPSVPKDAKVALRDDVLPDGTFVPAGAFLAFLPYVQGRMPSLWPDPLQFRPERFEDADVLSISPYLLPAFQAGPRMCLGQRMAYMEAAFVLGSLLRDFDVVEAPQAVTPDGRDPLYRKSMTLMMQDGFNVRFAPRSRAQAT